MSSTRNVLVVESLRVRYGRAMVLDSLDLRVAEGEVCALVGRNGAGKSSLIRCLLGQQKPAGGKIEIFGRGVWRHRAHLMNKIGVVPEEPDAPPSMSANGLARFCSRLYPSWNQAGYDGRLDRFGVPKNVAFSSLSKGQKAQVMMALALAPSPSFLVLDDPTLGLDIVARNAFFEDLIDELADRGITVLLTSHDLPGIERIATQIALLQEGKIHLDEGLESFKARHRRLLVSSEVDLDPAAMEPLRQSARGRQREYLVSRFDQDLFEQWAAVHGPAAVRIETTPLDELLLALVDDKDVP